MNRRRVEGIGLATVLGLGLTTLMCTGPEGPAGPPGPPGPNGASGAPGAAGSNGANGVLPDGGLALLDGSTAMPSSCLSPCHGFGGIVEQWRTSTHYSAAVANLGGSEVASWTSPGQPCGNCHAIDGIQQRVAGTPGANVADAGPDAGPAIPNVANGHLEYRNVNGALAEATYTGVAKVASVSCVTCHSVNDQNDPHRTGQPWTPGSFPLQVPTGKDDPAILEKSPDTTAVVGTGVKLGPANTCVWCHKSRKDVTNYITASNRITSLFWGPHEGPQSDIATGLGGYPYAGKTYAQSTHEQKLTCVDCHMPPVATNGGTPNHSFYAQISACQSCHAGATSFDVLGGQSDITRQLQLLRAALNNAGLLTRETIAGSGPLAASDLADNAFSDDRARPNGGPDGGVPVLTADQAGALYNYFVIGRGSALGVHNPIYVRELLYDSYVAIVGSPMPNVTRP